MMIEVIVVWTEVVNIAIASVIANTSNGDCWTFGISIKGYVANIIVVPVDNKIVGDGTSRSDDFFVGLGLCLRRLWLLWRMLVISCVSNVFYELLLVL